MTDANNPAVAKLVQLTNATGANARGAEVKAHFNPETLSMTIRNAMEEAKHDMTQGRPSQLVASSEVSLSVQLLFDTTMEGTDVRQSTAQIAEMMHPGAVVAREEGKRRPSRVAFVWNEFRFEGLITDYSETLDYFSEEGIPLRSSVDLSLTKYDAAVPAPSGASAADGVGAGSAPPTAPVASGDSLDDATDKAASGAPKSGAAKEKATNEVAAANAVENKKNPEVDELASPSAAFSAGASAGAFGSPLGGGAFASAGAGAGIDFGDPPAAFASGDAGFGLDLGASAGVGVSLGGGGGLAAGASLGIGADGPFAEAGVSASGGDTLGLDSFVNLNPPSASISSSGSLGGELSFDLPGISAGATAGAGVSLGGAAGIGAGLQAGAIAGANIGGGQSTNVGREINLADIIFKEDD